MKSHRLSLSRYALALECAYWARPDLTWEEKPVGREARIGTMVHRLAELHVLRQPVTLEGADDEIAEAERIFGGPLKTWLDVWAQDGEPLSTWVELRLRYDTRKDLVRQVPRRGEPGYERPGPGEVTGELDLVRVYRDFVDVIDIKTGSPRHVHEEQLRAYGVLASRFFGVPRVRISFLYARKTKLTLTDPVELDGDTLDAEAGRLGKTLRRLPLAEPKPGDHCTYRCPMGRALCPAWVTQTTDEETAA
jgi:hypothetical protein